MQTIGRILLVVVWIICFYKISRYVLVFMYEVFNNQRLTYFKAVLPRNDSKADRDLQKELAKDMKEKIWRMAQVYSSLHKLWELNVWDTMMRKVFDKPMIKFTLHYEDGLLYFLMATYPEYRLIVESALAAQYSDVSLEPVEKPDFFPRKYSDLIPIQTEKEWAYPIRIAKQMEDDPMNTIMDGIAKVSVEDTFTVVMSMKPETGAFNKRALKLADGLYRKDSSITEKQPLWKKLLPWNWFGFLVNGPSDALVEKYWDTKRGDPMIRMVKPEEEALNIMAEEAGQKAYTCSLMLASSSNNPERVKQNIYNIVSAYSIYSDQYNNELDQPEVVADLFGWIMKPLWKLAMKLSLPGFLYKLNVFTANELAALYHLPDGTYNRSPIIKWMDYKTLPAPDNLPQLKEEQSRVISWVIADEYKWWKISAIIAWMQHESVWHKIEDNAKIHWFKTYKDWILLWVNVYRNRYSPVYMKKKDRTRHHYVIGKSGTGKSVYISALARQDIWNGDGVCVIDPHGDLVEDILSYIPKERAKDVVYFNAWNEERPMGLNLYQIKDFSEADRAVNDAVEIFIKMFGPEIFGPRIQEYFKYWSLTLLEDLEDGATLIDVPRLFTDEWFRDYKTAKVKNPVVRNFRDKTYNAMGDREKQEIIPYFTSKFVSFITNSLIRNIIGQTKSAFNFREVMDNRKILLINLSKGAIWELNAQLLWMIIVSKIYNAAMSRADMDEADRKFFYLYVDEFQNFVTDTFADILSEARKYKLCLIMAHQFIAQLDGDGWEKSKVKDAVFGNVWTMQSFKVGAPDAEFLEKEYSPTLVAQDILWISNYKAYLKLNINNATSRVFSLNAIYTQDYQSKRIAEILKQYSEKKYGRKKEFVDAEISARLGILGDEDDTSIEDLSAKQAEQAKVDAVAQGVTPAASPAQDQTLPQETGS